MICTEAEAKTKACPFIAAPPSEVVCSVGKDNEVKLLPIIGPSRCIASGCMMWRWLHSEHTAGKCGLAGDTFYA